MSRLTAKWGSELSANRSRRASSATVVVLGCVSLLNHAASEMITPLLPNFLRPHCADVPVYQVFYWSVVPGMCVLMLIAFGVPRDAPGTIGNGAQDSPIRQRPCSGSAAVAPSVNSTTDYVNV